MANKMRLMYPEDTFFTSDGWTMKQWMIGPDGTPEEIPTTSDRGGHEETRAG